MAADSFLSGLPQIITAIGGLGTAAFGLVEATKAFGGGVNHFGFKGIKAAVMNLTPSGGSDGTGAAMSQQKILATLQANWFNGADLGSQKAIAKSLIKLNFNEANAEALAADKLKAVASSMAGGTALKPEQSDLFGRFDLIVTALLDEAYQCGDQMFRNRTKMVAMLIAVLLAIVGSWAMAGTPRISGQQYTQALIVGLLATPLAPIAKDLSTALATAVNALQLVKK
jgi:hypothetical protein